MDDNDKIIILDSESLEPIMEIDDELLSINYTDSQIEKGTKAKRFLTRISIPLFSLFASVLLTSAIILIFCYDKECSKFNIGLMSIALLLSLVVFGALSVLVSSIWLKMISKVEDTE